MRLTIKYKKHTEMKQNQRFAKIWGEIVSAVEYLMQHPEIKHGDVRIAFNPDEEIGQGAHKFDVKQFGADWAYTMDGGEIGELE